MTLSLRLYERYMAIRNECAITTAADNRFAAALFNMLASLHTNFPTHPAVYVYDLGLTPGQRKELQSVPWLELKTVEPFAPHWRLNWSWKHFIALQPAERYIIHCDAGVVFLRSLEMWFLSIQENSYLAFGQNQPLSQITPSNYWSLVGLDCALYKDQEAFGAGVFGFDKQSGAGDAVREAFLLAKNGWSLGCSATETRTDLDRSVVRDCHCFRHDQTLINLTLRKHIGGEVLVRQAKKYLGLGRGNDHPSQFLWHARRAQGSMKYIWSPLQDYTPRFWLNRLAVYPRLVLAPYKGYILNLAACVSVPKRPRNA